MSKRLDANGFHKFGAIDKLAYAAGDFGCNMSFALKSYLMVYWTQYMKMEESLYALLLVVVQVWLLVLSFQSLFMTIVGMLPMFVFMPFIAKIVRKYGKKEASSIGYIFSILACILMFVLPITGDNQGMMIYLGCQILNGLGMGIGMCVGYSMMADAIAYNEWKFGVRDEGTIWTKTHLHK